MYGRDTRTFVIRRVNGCFLEYLQVFQNAGMVKREYGIAARRVLADYFTWTEAWNHFVKNPLNFKDWSIVEASKASEDEHTADVHLYFLSKVGNHLNLRHD